MAGDDDQSEQTHASAATHFVLPPFWSAKPDLWFTTVEAKFQISKITKEETRFNHVLTILPPDVAAEVSDVILKPHDTEPYTCLKQAIVSRTCITETQRLKQLLGGQELGSRKPSQLLRHMPQR